MIKVNEERCIGCGLCVNLCPEVFELGENGKTRMKEGADLEKNRKSIREAKESCPARAINNS